MTWGEIGQLAVWLGFPVAFGALVGELYRMRLRDELTEAKRLADKTYLELDKARFELEELQTTMNHIRREPPHRPN